MKVKLIEQEVKSKVEMPKPAEVKELFEKIKLKISGKPMQTANKDEEAELTQIAKYLEHMAGEQVNVRHILIRSPGTAPAAERADAKKKLEGVLLR